MLTLAIFVLVDFENVKMVAEYGKPWQKWPKIGKILGCNHRSLRQYWLSKHNQWCNEKSQHDLKKKTTVIRVREDDDALVEYLISK